MMGRSSIKKSKGQLESEISDAVTRFEKEHMGRGPLETRTHILDDMIIVRQKGALTKSELLLLKTGRTDKARDLVKQVRTELIENGRSLLEDIIRGISRRRVRSLHSDISTITGEKMIVLTLDRKIEFELIDHH